MWKFGFKMIFKARKNGPGHLARTFLGIVALVSAACSHTDADLVSGSATDGEVEFAFAFAETRVNMDDDGRGTFEEGDRIGLYISNTESGQSRYVVLTLESGVWMPRLKRSELGRGEVSFAACYPAVDESAAQPASGKHTHAVAQTQSDGGYASSDLLWANRSVDMGSWRESVISFSFTHAMHRVRIALTRKNGEPLPEDLTVEVRSRLSGSVSIASGSSEPDAAAEEAWITPLPGKQSGDFRLLLFPQDIAPYTTGDGWVRIKTGGKTLTYQAPSQIGGSSRFDAGKTTTLNLSLTEGGVVPPPDPDPDPGPGDLDFKNTTHWVAGVKGLDYPRDNEASVKTKGPFVEDFPQGEWFNVAGFGQFLIWSSDYSWYDCDKDNPELGIERPGKTDGMMCWAASASNLLHWWMIQNKEYIKKYDEKYGVNPWPKYPRPSTDFTGNTTSKIFDFFRETCKDKSGSSHFGVNWFITGVSANIPVNNADVHQNFGGYFSKLFKSSDGLAKSEKSLYQDKFNQLVKDAFLKKQGLGFTITLPGFGSHAMVIWGMEFDADGYASALYYVDNNDHFKFETEGGSEPKPEQRHRLIRQPITYKSDGVYMNKYKINSLEIVDLGRSIWEREFGKLPEPQE